MELFLYAKLDYLYLFNVSTLRSILTQSGSTC